MPLGFCWKGNYTTKRNVSIFCLNVRKLFQDECWYWLARCTLDKAQMSKHWNQSTKMYGGMITRQFSLDCWILLSCEQHSRGDIYLLAVFEVASTPAWVFVFFSWHQPEFESFAQCLPPSLSAPLSWHSLLSQSNKTEKSQEKVQMLNFSVIFNVIMRVDSVL